MLLAVSFQVAAEGSIHATHTQSMLTASGQMLVSSRFHTDLPEQLKQALNQGVSLTFILNYRLAAPWLAAYRFEFNQWISKDNTIQYKLSYHPLTNRYRVSVGTFFTEYNNLETALRGVGAVANWQVPVGRLLEGVKVDEIRAEIRLVLSASQLPKPFQINAFTSKNWQLDSGWQPLNILQE